MVLEHHEVNTHIKEVLVSCHGGFQSHLCQQAQPVLEAVGTKVLAQTDGSWELELQIPRQITGPAEEVQIVNRRPGSLSQKGG